MQSFPYDVPSIPKGYHKIDFHLAFFFRIELVELAIKIHILVIRYQW